MHYYRNSNQHAIPIHTVWHTIYGILYVIGFGAVLCIIDTQHLKAVVLMYTDTGVYFFAFFHRNLIYLAGFTAGWLVMAQVARKCHNSLIRL